MGLGSNDISLKVGFDIDRFTSELSKTNGLLNNWAGRIQGSILTAFSIERGIRAFTDGVGYAVRTLAQFEAEMSKVKAITGATSGEFENLKNNATALSGVFKAIDIAKLETEFGRLGFSTSEILNSTEATINLATATGENLANSAVIAGSTLRAFNLDAKEMGRVTDVMAGALNRSGLDLSNFAEAIKYVAPNAHAAGISIEETSALLGILADNGIKGSMAGTSLRRVITDLSTEAKPLSEKLKELGERGLSAHDAFEEIGRIGATTLLVLANNADKVNSLSTELKDVKGEAKAMADVMQDNLVGDWAKFTAEVDKSILSLELFVPALRAAVQGAKEYLAAESMTKMESDLSKAVRNIVENDLNKLALAFKDSKTPAKELIDEMKRLNLGQGFLDMTEKEFNDLTKTLGLSDLAARKLRMAIFDIGGMVGGTRDLEAKDSKFGVTKGTDAYAMGMSLGPKIDKTKGSGLFGLSPEGIYDYDTLYKQLSGTMKMLAKDAGYVTDAYKEMFGAVDQTNDGFALMNEEIAPSVQIAIDKMIAAGMSAKKAFELIAFTSKQIAHAIRNTITTAFAGIGQAIGQALAGGSIEAALLGTLGRVAVQVGELAIGIGVTLLGIKEALYTLNPFVAIAAGIALVALGSYASTQASNIANSSGGGNSFERSATNVNVNGQMRIQGRDLVYIYDQEKGLDRSRTGG